MPQSWDLKNELAAGLEHDGLGTGFGADLACPGIGVLGDDRPGAVMDRHDPPRLEQANGFQGIGRPIV